MASSISSKNNQNQNQAEMERLERLFPGIPRPFLDFENPKIAIIEYEGFLDRASKLVIEIRESTFELWDLLSQNSTKLYKLKRITEYQSGLNLGSPVVNYCIAPSSSNFQTVDLGKFTVERIEFFDNAQIFRKKTQEALIAIYRAVDRVKVLANLIFDYLQHPALPNIR